MSNEPSQASQSAYQALQARTALGTKLSALRTSLTLTPEAVEALIEGCASRQYIEALELGEVRFPAPHVLFALASAYHYPYEKLMELAGHIRRRPLKGELAATEVPRAQEELREAIVKAADTVVAEIQDSEDPLDVTFPALKELVIVHMNAAVAPFFETKERELEEVKAWKQSALAVEASWSCQAIAKLLKLPLGSDIRAHIEPKIRALRTELAEASGRLVAMARENARAHESYEGMNAAYQQLSDDHAALIEKCEKLERDLAAEKRYVQTVHVACWRQIQDALPKPAVADGRSLVRRTVDAIKAGQADADRLDRLAELLQWCPHTELTYNDDQEEGLVGYGINVDGCDPISIFNSTLRGALDQLREIIGRRETHNDRY